MKNQMIYVATLATIALVGCAKTASVDASGGGKLTLDKPATVTLHRGGMAKADIKIGRQDFPGDVSVRFTNLPKGVDVVDETSKIVGDRGSFTLRAAETADLVDNFVADVTATGGAKGVSVSEPMNISVKPRE